MEEKQTELPEMQTEAQELSREEVLSRAKNENKYGDERQRSQMQWANYAGFIATEFACVIIMFSKIFTGNEFSPEFFCIMFTGVAAQNIVQACINKNKKTKVVFTLRRDMDDKLVLHNRLKEIRAEKGISQGGLAAMVGVSRNTISSIETGQYCPTAKLALILCVALDKRFEEIFYF